MKQFGVAYVHHFVGVRVNDKGGHVDLHADNYKNQKPLTKARDTTLSEACLGITFFTRSIFLNRSQQGTQPFLKQQYLGDIQPPNSEQVDAKGDFNIAPETTPEDRLQVRSVTIIGADSP